MNGLINRYAVLLTNASYGVVHLSFVNNRIESQHNGFVGIKTNTLVNNVYDAHNQFSVTGAPYERREYSASTKVFLIDEQLGLSLEKVSFGTLSKIEKSTNNGLKTNTGFSIPYHINAAIPPGGSVTIDLNNSYSQAISVSGGSVTVNNPINPPPATEYFDFTLIIFHTAQTTITFGSNFKLATPYVQSTNAEFDIIKFAYVSGFFRDVSRTLGIPT